MTESRSLDRNIIEQINTRAESIEKHLNANVIYYKGIIHPALVKDYRDFIERVVSKKGKKDTVAIFLKTQGGSVQAVEKMVEIVRHHYNSVYFIVPDYAMSAGTVFCMSGDKIFMDYSSALGPIDPQVPVIKDGQEHWVPALGYLDWVEKLVEKSAKDALTDAEYGILVNQDLGLLRSYEQARDLSIDLMKKWLVKYKFRSWKVHRTDPKLRGQAVTLRQKEKRAGKISEDLGNNKIWHSHGRMIGPDTLRDVLRLEIEDYSSNKDLSEPIRLYNDLLADYTDRQGLPFYLHSHHL